MSCFHIGDSVVPAGKNLPSERAFISFLTEFALFTVGRHFAQDDGEGEDIDGHAGAEVGQGDGVGRFGGEVVVVAVEERGISHDAFEVPHNLKFIFNEHIFFKN